MKLLFLIFIVLSLHVQANTCLRTLELPVPRADRTEILIGYLTHLVDQRIIGEKELTGWRNVLEIGELTNPIALNSTSVDSSSLIHYGEIQRQIEAKGLDVSRLFKWADESLRIQQDTSTRRSQVEDVTKDIFQRIHFLPVPPAYTRLGTYLGKRIRVFMGPILNSMPAPRTHTFEMMSTPVTQLQWAEIMYSKEGGLEERDVNTPVTNISWWSAVRFANKLSETAGFKPVYDLSDIRFVGTSIFGWLNINAPNGNVYLAEGYRLPTAFELDHVLNEAGFKTVDSRYGEGASEYAWLGSDFQVNPVAQLKPYVVNGHLFYDLIGNVFEWSHVPRIGGHEPTFRKRIAHGGPIPQDQRAHTTSLSKIIGFRLVRTLKP